MKTLDSLTHSPILSVVSHPDDVEMHHAALLQAAPESRALIATNGEASTLNFTRRSLC